MQKWGSHYSHTTLFFKQNVTIHPEYYYNSTTVTTNPKYVLYSTATILEELVILASVTVTMGATACDYGSFDFTAKNILLYTSVIFVTASAGTAIIASIIYPDEALESFTHNLQATLPYVHDYLLFSGESTATDVNL